eukprot:5781676-Amphidinium_carterae.1
MHLPVAMLWKIMVACVLAQMDSAERHLFFKWPGLLEVIVAPMDASRACLRNRQKRTCVQLWGAVERQSDNLVVKFLPLADVAVNADSY